VDDPELFSTLHKEHGPVLKIWMGPTQLLVSIFDARIVNEVLEKAKDRVPTSQVALQLAFGKGSLFFAPFSKVSYFLFAGLFVSHFQTFKATRCSVCDILHYWVPCR